MKLYPVPLFVAKYSVQGLSILLLSVASLSLSACQKQPDAEPQVKTEAQSQPVTTSISAKEAQEIARKHQEAEAAAQKEREINLQVLENNAEQVEVTANHEPDALNPEQAIKGTQITDVKYKSANGENLSVVFETSATGVLNAIVTLPNKPQMILSAPEGQGNNPTYRSKDGKFELISHGGGSSIDLLQNGQLTSYNATSAEAEVITQP